MKKQFISPEIKLLKLETEDIMVLSTGTMAGWGDDNNPDSVVDVGSWFLT